MENIKNKEITDQDISTLKNEMVHGIVALERALFTQAALEDDRLNHLRENLKHIEQHLLSPVFFNTLPDSDKIKLYQLVTKNIESSISFLGRLHGSVAQGIDALNSIESLKPKKKDVKETDPEVERVKNLIINTIKDKKNGK